MCYFISFTLSDTIIILNFVIQRKAAWIAPSFDDFPKTQSKEVKKKEKTIDQQPGKEINVVK